MSNVYLVPNSGDFEELSRLTSRVGMTLLSPTTVRDFILETNALPQCIVAMSARDLLVLNRHAATLLTVLPVAIANAPGLVYTGDWMTAASALPPMDWREMEAKFQKSGLTAHTPEELETRGRGTTFPSHDPSAIESLRARVTQGDLTPEVTADEIAP